MYNNWFFFSLQIHMKLLSFGHETVKFDLLEQNTDCSPGVGSEGREGSTEGSVLCPELKIRWSNHCSLYSL